MSEKKAVVQGQQAREGLSDGELGEVRGGLAVSRTLDNSVLTALRLPKLPLSTNWRNSLISNLVGSHPVG